MLDPFWGPSGGDSETRACYHRYREVGASIFEMVSLDDADVAILPFDWTYATSAIEIPEVEKVASSKAYSYLARRELGLNFAELARQAGKRVVVFYETDVMQEVPIDNAIIFSTSLYRSTRRSGMFAIPSWTEDLLTKLRCGEELLREKQPRPIVSFCGYAPPLGMPWGKAKVKEEVRQLLLRTPLGRALDVSSAYLPRVRAIRALSESQMVGDNFIVRPYQSLAKGPRLRVAGTPLEAWVEPSSQVEFFENMLGSDYVLCVRGWGNFSHRLYEAMACGRIPVFIDTDCVLPFDFMLRWKEFCVWVKEPEVGSISKRVADFHQALSGEEFKNRQTECRRTWENWISPEGFFANFYRHLSASASPST
jgi:hypothetical protein